MSDDILIHRENRVLTLTFNRLARQNALNADMLAALAQALEQAAGDDGAHAVVIQGHETVFTAGRDWPEWILQTADSGNAGNAANPANPAKSESPAENATEAAERFMRALAAFPKPVIAAVCGPAVGLGAALLLHCDLIYAGDNAAFSLPYVHWGLCPEAAASLLLPQALGARRAAEALLLGDPFTAETALEAGLVNRVVPPAECHALAQAQAARLAAKPLPGLMATKALLKGEQQQAALMRLPQESRALARLLREPAAKQALQALAQGRKPDAA